MKKFTLFSSLLCVFASVSHAAGIGGEEKMQAVVNTTIQPLMQKFDIPGMAVAVTIRGKHYLYNYGVASKETRKKVTEYTLFEIGSLSKTFTATLASYAQTEGRFSLSDNASTYFPSLRGTSFDYISLMNLGTHTAGGLPLQAPDEVNDTARLMTYLKNWTPSYPAGVFRKYSNVSIGLLGMATAQSMQMSFEDALEKKLFPALGMTHSYINVPADQMKNYAQGYTAKDLPVRLNPGILSSEAYGIKTASADLIRFIDANIAGHGLDEKWRRAIMDTHTGYFRVGAFTQDLMWEQYAYPVTLTQLLAGNDPSVIYEGAAAVKLTPPSPPQANVLLNKTGSTNGFSTYAAFIPSEQIGIVILANKSYPIDQRVTAAYNIMTELNHLSSPDKN